jgi:linoleoyl-CoA desaturase
MWVKIVFWLGTWLGSYLLLLFGNLPGWAMFLVALYHGLTHLFIAFNISHDANHDSISDNPTVNRILSYSLDLIGVSSFFWRIAHNREHHGFVNIHPQDSSIKGYGLLKFTPEETPKKAYEYQQWYAILVYALTTINYVTRKDFKFLSEYLQEGKKLTLKEWVVFIAGKSFYYLYVFVIPMIVLDLNFLTIFGMFILVHIILGWILTLVFQCGHLTEDAYYPKVDESGKVSDSWTLHIIKTTGNFGRKNRFFSWLVGGINIHLVHHLYPRICHTHYAPLTDIIKDTVEKEGYTFKEIDTFWEAIVSHFRLLKKLGIHYHD